MSVQINPLEMKTRYMSIKLTLDQGQFPNSGNQKTITANSDDNSLSVECEISKQSGFLQNNAMITIYGMSAADCNAFTRFNSTYQMYQNEVQIYAGYELGSDGLPPLVYSGQVYTAAPDFNNASRPFRIVSISGIFDQNIMAPHTNPAGQIELNTLFKNIVSGSKNPNLVYTPMNVTGAVLNPVYHGSWIKQLQQAAFDYGYQMNIDNNKVMIAPKGQALTSNYTHVSKDTGMIGYPTVVELGIDILMWFDPSIEFGQKITVQSTELDIANADWFVNGYAYSLYNRGEKWHGALKLNQYLFTIPGATGG